MEISVVIPTYNRAQLVSRAVKSALEQSLRPCEVIVVDDGSTDQTVSNLVRAFAGIKLVQQEHSGVSAARNAGIGQACGEWIAFLDSDDEWKTGKLEQQAKAIDKERKKGREFLVCHTDEIWIRNGTRVNPMDKHAKPQGWIFESCLPRCCVSPSSVVLHRNLFTRFGVFDETLPACEDYDLWLRIFSRLPVLLVPERLVVKYGGHADQLSRQYWGMDRFRVQALEKILQTGKLEVLQQQQVIHALKEKIAILVNGFEKRGNIDQAVHYRNKMGRLKGTAQWNRWHRGYPSC